MENLFKKIPAKAIPYILIVLLLTGYAYFGVNLWLNRTYNEGFQQGKLQVYTNYLSSFLQTGRVVLPIPVNPAGKFDPTSTTTFNQVLVPPQINNSTTTQ